MKKWCSKIWIYVMCAIGIIMAILLTKNWSIWSIPMKVVALNAVILPLHVIEEWIIPGGFHYAYNINKGVTDEKLLHKYPMNQLTDMLTNFIAEIFFCTLVFLKVGASVAFGVMAFDIMEAFMHTLIGIRMKKQFKDKGKKTIYGPGSITAYFAQLPVGIFLAVWYFQNGLTLSDVTIGIITMILGSICMINLPEGLLKKENNKYEFKDAGYFKKFLIKE